MGNTIIAGGEKLRVGDSVQVEKEEPILLVAEVAEVGD